MAGKIKKFKSKQRKAAVKRVKVTNAQNKTDRGLLIERINTQHRMMGKTGERKLRSVRRTKLSKTHQKLKKALIG